MVNHPMEYLTGPKCLMVFFIIFEWEFFSYLLIPKLSSKTKRKNVSHLSYFKSF